jgi:hypothetical protein
MSLRVNLFVVIGDAPSIAKTFNVHQYNGHCGCFNCLHPGEPSGQSSRIYPYLTDTGDLIETGARTNQIYLEQVEKSLSTGQVFEGVKGPCALSRYIPCPERRIIDYMHCCIIGTGKYTIELVLDSSNSDKPYYLGNSQLCINELLQNIQYPSDYPRLQRHFKDFVHYKANEIKSFLLNAAIYVFSFVLKEPYYSHIVKYIIFLRLLTQSRVSNNDIQLAARLINYFVLKYQSLYGRRHLTYNLHSHLHLHLQVFLFGPLHLNMIK